MNQITVKFRNIYFECEIEQDCDLYATTACINGTDLLPYLSDDFVDELQKAVVLAVEERAQKEYADRNIDEYKEMMKLSGVKL